MTHIDSKTLLYTIPQNRKKGWGGGGGGIDPWLKKNNEGQSTGLEGTNENISYEAQDS